MPIVINTLADEWFRYVPDYEDNRTLEVPMTCEINPMTVAERRRLERKYTPRKLTGAAVMAAGIKMVEDALSAHVRNVFGLHVDGVDITTGEQLAKLAPAEMINDIWEAVQSMSRLNEGLAKKSDSPSG